MFAEILERFVKESTVTVMVRAILGRAFCGEEFDALFEQFARRQYTRELLFSDVVSLMMLVSCGLRQSVSAAYKAMREKLGVSRPAFYCKLNGIEPQVSQAIVRYSVEKLAPVVEQLNGQSGVVLEGYRLQILDGNLLRKTEHRLEVLRAEGGSPLPGKSLVVLDPQLQLATDFFPCEDAYTQERALLEEILPRVKAQSGLDRRPQFLYPQFFIWHWRARWLLCHARA